MPTRLLLDGDDLASLMHRVRVEMGPNAVVVRAERVRTGGVAGFFAKEHYELTVEVPEPPRRSLRRQAVPRSDVGSGMAGLLDAADAAEAWDAGQAAPAGRPAAPEPGLRVSTDADTFASLLASIDDMADVPTAKPPHATVAPATAVPATAVPVAPGMRAALLGSTPSSGLLDRFGAPISSPAVPVGDGGASTRPAGGDRRALLRLGVPATLLGSGPLDEALPLSDLLARLVRPPALVRAPGSIVAVVGESAQALAVATQLAARVRQDPHDVVLAGQMHAVAGHSRRLLSSSAAALHRARCADGEQVSIVAIGVGPQVEAWPAAAELLADLGPDQAWAVVDARRKTADLRAWVRSVGRPREFDVVAVAALHDTQEPGTVLDLGVPVGWIDGLPATPVVWAAVLSERLESGTRWD
ncbi:hypothetical protein [Pengzhenrongella phosphoraccumulans]|uniref:hypothetical protein n=1 Tax=Pengzhenrongella phosphoraccumulans TaxID=3114394 RepID=UPI003890D354